MPLRAREPPASDEAVPAPSLQAADFRAARVMHCRVRVRRAQAARLAAVAVRAAARPAAAPRHSVAQVPVPSRQVGDVRAARARRCRDRVRLAQVAPLVAAAVRVAARPAGAQRRSVAQVPVPSRQVADARAGRATRCRDRVRVAAPPAGALRRSAAQVRAASPQAAGARVVRVTRCRVRVRLAQVALLAAAVRVLHGRRRGCDGGPCGFRRLGNRRRSCLGGLLWIAFASFSVSALTRRYGWYSLRRGPCLHDRDIKVLRRRTSRRVGAVERLAGLLLHCFLPPVEGGRRGRRRLPCHHFRSTTRWSGLACAGGARPRHLPGRARPAAAPTCVARSALRSMRRPRAGPAVPARIPVKDRGDRVRVVDVDVAHVGHTRIVVDVGHVGHVHACVGRVDAREILAVRGVRRTIDFAGARGNHATTRVRPKTETRKPSPPTKATSAGA